MPNATRNPNNRRRRSRRKAPQAGKPANNSAPASTTKARVRQRKRTPRAALHGCGLLYAGALFNPGSAPLACVPSQYPTYTATNLVWADITFTVPAAGGFVVADPRIAATNSLACLAASNATYVPSAPGSIDLNNNVSEYVLGKTNAPFTNGNIGVAEDQVSYRVVGAVLKIRWVGTELERGGTMSCLCDINHDTLNSRTNADMLGQPASRTISVSRRWTTIWNYPVASQDYILSITPIAGGQVIGPSFASSFFYYMGAYISPASANNSFQARLEMQVEYAGKPVRSSAPTKSDPIGLSATVQAAVSLVPSDQPEQDAGPSFLSSVESAARSIEGYASTARSIYDAGRSAYRVLYGTGGNSMLDPIDMMIMSH